MGEYQLELSDWYFLFAMQLHSDNFESWKWWFVLNMFDIIVVDDWRYFHGIKG